MDENVGSTPTLGSMAQVISKQYLSPSPFQNNPHLYVELVGLLKKTSREDLHNELESLIDLITELEEKDGDIITGLTSAINLYLNK